MGKQILHMCTSEECVFMKNLIFVRFMANIIEIIWILITTNRLCEI